MAEEKSMAGRPHVGLNHTVPSEPDACGGPTVSISHPDDAVLYRGAVASFTTGWRATHLSLDDTNDLEGTFANADEANTLFIKEWVEWVYWEMPSYAQGSVEVVNEYIESVRAAKEGK